MGLGLEEGRASSRGGACRVRAEPGERLAREIGQDESLSVRAGPGDGAGPGEGPSPEQRWGLGWGKVLER